MAAGDSRSQASGTSPGPQNGGQGPQQALAPVSFYVLLQLAEDASLEELRQAFRRQSKRLHPDTTSLPAAQAQDSFRQLRQAYGTLLDPERRRAYDASLAAARALAGQALRSSPGASASSPAGAAPARAGGAGGPGLGPSQKRGGPPQGGPARMANSANPANPASTVSSFGTSPGPASRQSSGGQGASGQGLGDGLPKPDSVRRTLSGGEWFALLLLGLALVFCLVLGVGLAWMRGTDLVREPSWWSAQEPMALPGPGPSALSQTGTSPGVALAHSLPAAGPDAPLQPSSPGD